MDPQEIERWIQDHQKWTDGQLRTTIVQKVPHCLDHVASQELLDRREKNRRAADHIDSERRHKETMNEAARGVRFAKWAVIFSAVGLVVGIIGMLLPFVARTPVRTDAPQPSTSLRVTNHPADAITSKPATEPTPESLIPKPDKKPELSPTPP